MRPPEFTGGNTGDLFMCRGDGDASMRPPEFTGGNLANAHRALAHVGGLQ